jgi:hypothetical protein
VGRPTTALALPDYTLWALIKGDGDVLAGVTFEDAVLEDPRRVDALVWQAIDAGYREAGMEFPEEPGTNIYEQGMNVLRARDGAVTARGIADLTLDNLDRTVFFHHMPSYMRQALRRNIHFVDQGIDNAVAVVKRAAAVARRNHRGADNVAWNEMAEALTEHKGTIRAALAEHLPGPVGQRRALGFGRPMIQGPVARRRGGRAVEVPKWIRPGAEVFWENQDPDDNMRSSGPGIVERVRSDGIVEIDQYNGGHVEAGPAEIRRVRPRGRR